MRTSWGLLGVLILNFGCAAGFDNATVVKIEVHVNRTSVPPPLFDPNLNVTKEDANEGDPIYYYTTETSETSEDTVAETKSIPNINNLNFPYNLQIIKEVLKQLKNDKCVRDTTLILEGMTQHDRWALEMFDSFPKFPVGIIYGNHYQMGNFDECVGVERLLKEEEDEIQLQGQYCLADIHFQRKKESNGRFARSTNKAEVKTDRNKFNNSVIHWGICLPSSCSTEDAQIFVHEVFTSAVHNFDVVHVRVDSDKCYHESSPPFTALEIVYSCIIGAFLMFTLLATCFHCMYIRKRKRYINYNVDSLRSRKPKLLHEVVICFSCINTIGKFLHVKPNELNLECICGIKFLSMSLIIVGHSLIFFMGGPMVNRDFFKEMSTKLENSPLLNNALLVDTFLLVGGFLLCRLLLIELDKRKGKLNVIILYFARYIRLTPSYIVVIGLYMTYLYRTGSGPFWKSRIGLERDRCLSSWWTNVLYVNNYVNTDQLCMFQSWYLAVDYHLFIISPLIIYPLWRKRKFGESLLIVCILTSIATPFWITFKDNLDPTLMAYPPEMEDISTNFYFLNVYIKTHMRSSSYFLGLLFGYLVHRLQSTGTKIKPLVVWLGLILSASLGIMSMYSIVIFYNPEHTENSLESAAYSSLHRVAWSLAIGWIIVVCVTDNAEIINKFLSYKFFIPASRLTYCAYLANGLIEVYNMGVLRQPVYLSKYELACKILGHLILTYTVAFILCIFFESPIHSLEKILLRKDKVKEQKQNSTLTPMDE
ncbi:nose resistant to fluoxetine protein 6-like [Anoplophora glabripennis]|uniref:nose resistant to fluoxetine protein 6-like n=1 Tax=Anoplophora glabripennis TaxID=217634 RepID=UPI000873948C|nr:nose resistant to fluoxetine protein 6-like [Anoplophora glabripennis]